MHKEKKTIYVEIYRDRMESGKEVIRANVEVYELEDDTSMNHPVEEVTVNLFDIPSDWACKVYCVDSA